MSYSIEIGMKIYDDDSEIVADTSRCYDVTDLSKIKQIAEHFGASAALLVNGGELGLDLDNSSDQLG